jgi:hypothetical protein
MQRSVPVNSLIEQLRGERTDIKRCLPLHLTEGATIKRAFVPATSTEKHRKNPLPKDAPAEQDIWKKAKTLEIVQVKTTCLVYEDKATSNRDQILIEKITAGDKRPECLPEGFGYYIYYVESPVLGESDTSTQPS